MVRRSLPRAVASRVVIAALAAGTGLPVASCGFAGSAPPADVAAIGSPGDALVANTVVVRVIDGDTLVVSIDDGQGNDAHVRLIGIDTPETTKPNTPIECFGKEASARLHELLAPGTPVLVERDAEERDRYGRLLAYVHRARDGLFVNEAMVVDGYAAALTIAPNTAHASELAVAATRARQQRRGLWGACPGPHAPAGGG